MAWFPIQGADYDGRRIIVAGGTYVRGGVEVCPQYLPALVTWDGREWVICDNTGERACILNPRWFRPLPPPPSG